MIKIIMRYVNLNNMYIPSTGKIILLVLITNTLGVKCKVTKKTEVMHKKYEATQEGTFAVIPGRWYVFNTKIYKIHTGGLSLCE